VVTVAMAAAAAAALSFAVALVFSARQSVIQYFDARNPRSHHPLFRGRRTKISRDGALVTLTVTVEAVAWWF